MENSIGRQLTDAQKQSLDSTLVGLLEFYSTPEGKEFVRICKTVIERHKGAKREPVLTPVQRKAFTFIKDCKCSGKNPSIRTIARHLGFTSSRSGFKVVQELTVLGLIRRDERGILRHIES